MTLELVKYRLPHYWDDEAVTWEAYRADERVFVCPPPKAERCSCGSTAAPSIANGRRYPRPGATLKVHRRRRGRAGSAARAALQQLIPDGNLLLTAITLP